MSIRRTVPDEPKSITAVARGPLPSTDFTVPNPYLSCETRSPAASSNRGPENTEPDPGRGLIAAGPTGAAAGRPVPNRLTVIGADLFGPRDVPR